ncbi:DUF2505 domain-containing protein [Rhodococcoides kyotonense]|uniref:DUF2505 domain-containing protein n=1 Tax=Rhodococcoides kyotonense TaxID=398843 RepID=A0A239MLP6_9NOCA|nr:DUF2505 domain-containing protein [Rhodococcus kyotonensis]SNT43636.1 Protein of unknown function [Rhodococcus kyotonensis]
MSRDFEFTVSSEHTPEEVYEALNSEEQWLARFEKAQKTDGYTLTKHEHGGLTVDITDEIGTSELPGFVKKVVRGTLLVTRTDSWGPLEGDRADGTLVGGTSAIPASVDGTLTLRPQGTGALLTVKGTSTVKIPLIGGKIESLINDMIKDMVEQETEETNDWASQQEEG